LPPVRRAGLVFQADPKFLKIEQNPAKAEQRKSKENPWIRLDLLVRIVPFQRVAPTPGHFFSRLGLPPQHHGGNVEYARFCPAAFGARLLALLSIDMVMVRGTVTWVSIFRKQLFENPDSRIWRVDLPRRSGLGLPDAGESRTGHAPLCFDQASDEGRIHRGWSARASAKPDRVLSLLGNAFA
jgi:hypothetical protein